MSNGNIRVVNLRNPGGQRVTKVDRTTIFGNPVKLGEVCPECGDIHVRDPQMKALVCYGRYLIRRLDSAAGDEFARAVRRIPPDARLGCWCAPAPCHADMLGVYLASGYWCHNAGMDDLRAHVATMANDAARQGELF